MQKEKKSSSIRLLLQWAGKEKYWMYLAVILSFFSGICTMIPYYGIYSLMSAVYTGTCTTEFVIRDAGIIAGGIVIRFLLFGASGVASHKGAYRALLKVRCMVIDHMAKVPLGALNERSTGEIKTVLNEDIEKLELFLAHNVPELICYLIGPVVVFIYLLTVNVPLALVSLPVGNVAAMAADYWAEYDGYAEGYYYAVKDDGTVAVAAVKYDGAEVPIPAELSGRKVTEVLQTVLYSGSDDVRTLVIPEGVTEIGEYAFSSCDNLQSVTLPATLESIGASAFSDCALISLTIPADTTLGQRAFSGNGLGYVTIGDGVTVGDWAFAGIGGNNVTIGDGVTVGANAFSDSEVHVLTLGEGNSLGASAFSGCTSLTALDIPANTSVGNWAFSECTGLNSVTINDGAVLNDRAFYGCTGLTNVFISAGVTEMGSMVFIGCTNLTVHCEAASRPDGWSNLWEYGVPEVVWGATA